MAFEKKKVLKEVEYGSQKIVISAGETSVDVRKYYEDERDGEWKPTKKGISLNKELLIEVLPELIKLMDEVDVEDMLEEIGYSCEKKEEQEC